MSSAHRLACSPTAAAALTFVLMLVRRRRFRRGAGPAVGGRDRDHRDHHHRRRAERADLGRGAEDRRSDSAAAAARAAADGADRGHAAERRRQPLRRRRRVRLRARRVIGTQMARDASLAADDRVEILLDTFRDQRSAFYFATNPSGALVDGLVASGQLNAEWDAIWNVRTRRTERGMGRGVRDSVQEPELPGRADRVGLQHRPAHLSKAGGGPLVRRAPGHAVQPGVGSGRDHQPRRA